MSHPPAAPAAGVGQIGLTARRGLLPPYAVLACSALFFWYLSLRALVYTIMPTVAANLGLSTSLASIVIAVQLLAYCISSWFAGSLPGSRKARVLAGALITLPAVVIVALSPNLWTLLPAAALTGFGMGVYIPLGISLIVEMGGRHRSALYLAIHEVAATLGAFGGSAFVAVSLPRTDWRGSFLAWCLVGIVATAIFAAVKDERGKGRVAIQMRPARFSRSLVLGSACYAVSSILLIGLISVLPLIMVRGWGLDQAYAASVTGYTRLAGLIGVFAAGLLADRLGHHKVILVLQVMAAVGVAAMAAGYGPLFLPGLVITAIGASGNIVLVPVLVMASFAPSQREQSFAVCTGFGGLTALVLSPALFGAMLDAGLPTGPMIFAAALALLLPVLTSRIPVHSQESR
jgi:MFS family permease